MTQATNTLTDKDIKNKADKIISNLDETNKGILKKYLASVWNFNILGRLLKNDKNSNELLDILSNILVFQIAKERNVDKILGANIGSHNLAEDDNCENDGGITAKMKKYCEKEKELIEKHKITDIVKEFIILRKFLGQEGTIIISGDLLEEIGKNLSNSDKKKNIEALTQIFSNYVDINAILHVLKSLCPTLDSSEVLMELIKTLFKNEKVKLPFIEIKTGNTENKIKKAEIVNVFSADLIHTYSKNISKEFRDLVMEAIGFPVTCSNDNLKNRIKYKSGNTQYNENIMSSKEKFKSGSKRHNQPSNASGANQTNNVKTVDYFDGSCTQEQLEEFDDAILSKIKELFDRTMPVYNALKVMGKEKNFGELLLYIFNVEINYKTALANVGIIRGWSETQVAINHFKNYAEINKKPPIDKSEKQLYFVTNDEATESILKKLKLKFTEKQLHDMVRISLKDKGSEPTDFLIYFILRLFGQDKFIKLINEVSSRLCNSDKIVGKFYIKQTDNEVEVTSVEIKSDSEGFGEKKLDMEEYIKKIIEQYGIRALNLIDFENRKVQEAMCGKPNKYNIPEQKLRCDTLSTVQPTTLPNTTPPTDTDQVNIEISTLTPPLASISHQENGIDNKIEGDSNDSKKSLLLNKIAGGVGGLLVIGLFLTGFLIYRKHKNQENNQEDIGLGKLGESGKSSELGKLIP